MKKLSISLLFLSLFFASFQSCETIKQTGEITRLKDCNFSLEGINALTLAGINLGDGSNLSGMEGGQLMQLANALFQKNLPISLDVMIKADNPNTKPALLSKMDYLVLIDGMELFTGQNTRQYTIGAGNYETIALPLQTELFKVMAEQSKEKITGLINKLSGKDKTPLEVTVKIKPYVSIGGASVPYPGYLTFVQKLQNK